MSFLTRKKRDTPQNGSVFEEVPTTYQPESLTQVLHDNVLRGFFRQFLMARMAIESLLFYESIELYEHLPHDEHRLRAGISMIEKFVVEESQYWVNLSAELRMELVDTRTKGSFTESSFAHAKAEIYNLMNMNFFESFLKEIEGHGDGSAPKLSFDHLPYQRQSFADMSEEGTQSKRGNRTESNVSSSTEDNSKKGTFSKMASIKFFRNKRASKARHMTFWEELAGDELDLDNIEATIAQKKLLL